MRPGTVSIKSKEGKEVEGQKEVEEAVAVVQLYSSNGGPIEA